MCHIILEQQVSIASATACYDKLLLELNEISPTSLLNATEDALRKCGVSRQKINYLKHLAEKVITNQIDFISFASKSETEVRSKLIQLKGIGNWSAEVYLMFCMQSPDIMPLSDLAIKNTLKELYNRQTLEEMEIVSKNWKPYRTIATFILWHHYLKSRNRI
jgi:DNA-3-methyladenine glycosylase II